MTRASMPGNQLLLLKQTTAIATRGTAKMSIVSIINAILGPVPSS